MKTVINSFAELNLPRPLQRTLHQIKFSIPTPIQALSIPPALEGKDILGIAQTGTGKTGAFGIPFLTQLYQEPGKVGLVLAPTRELAAQIGQVLRQLSKKLKMNGVVVVGGESFGRQVRELERNVDFVIATPGRLNDHLREGTIDLRRVGFLVLDEMDRMLDMGFAPQIKQIVRRLPKSRQTFLYSATLPKETAKLALSLLQSPVRIEIEPSKKITNITEKTLETSPVEKAPLLLNVMEGKPRKTLIFTRTKSRTEKVARTLGRAGYAVVNLHGGRTQGQRKRALNLFRKGTHPIMVATDVAGRGIDVTDIEQIINYDLPQCHEDYIHRIGRTARNGRSGAVLNFITKDDVDVQQILSGKKAAPSQNRGKSSRSQKRGKPRSRRKSLQFKKGKKRRRRWK